MKDAFNRNITYLRLSLTERCTLKCAYCRAGEGDCPKHKELSTEQFLRIVRVMAQLGIEKVRLTGGEPMLRRDLFDLISGIHAIPGIREIAMTTNGQHLPGQSAALKKAGLDRLNISIDSLRPERYAALTGGGSLAAVLTSIDEALAAGFSPLKLNAVLLRGQNDDEIDDFLALTRKQPIDVRFIELMPMGATDHTDRRIRSDEILGSHPELVPLPPRYASQPSADYEIPGYCGRIGLISPMSHRFCQDCNRVRVLSDGMLRPCLGDNYEVSLLPALAAAQDDLLLETIRQAIYTKPAANGFSDAFCTARNMSKIGG